MCNKTYNHNVGEQCPVVKKAIENFGEELGNILLWNETCFPMDDDIAMEQLDQLIEKKRLGEPLVNFPDA